ncbi:uncharacterized protein Dwil_GK19576 [Drosophila willistoni]|uniref:Heparan sulfate 2-O-sulfotransferase pipe n=1 Tax=Drosophila willistoni TaxID=7260 RepID=B4MXJ2_DROWI|nr:uncharacterized protein Dwil_GK19576 [Drosophila willistoni]
MISLISLSRPSLSSLEAKQLNNTMKAELDFIFYNRLEKTGSQSMTRLINALGKRNNFGTYRNVIVPKTSPIETFEEETEFIEQLMELERPSAYVEHANYMNFTQHDTPKPIYINLVRHPIQKVISAYYYQRHPVIYANTLLRNKNKKKDKIYFDRTFNDCVKQRVAPFCVFDSHNEFNNDWRRFSLHLCGNEEICTYFNSEIATQKAKDNVEREYAVIGSWEDTNITLAVLEAYIPRFFKDAKKVYYKQTPEFTVNTTPHDTHLDEEVEEYLQRSFHFEIELYQFIKQRLYKQYIAINKQKMQQEYENKSYQLK